MATVRQVKIAQKRAGLADAEYRALLQRVAGVRSCTQLDDHGRDRVLRAIQDAKPPLLRKLWALFYALRQTLGPDDIAHPKEWLLGVARKANADDAIPALERLSKPQLMKTVEALKARARPPRRRQTLVAPVGYSHDDGL